MFQHSKYNMITSSLLLFLAMGPSVLAAQDEFLIVSDYNAHKVYQVTPLTGEYRSLIDSTLNTPLGVAYDSVNNTVYVADCGTGIWRYSLTTSEESVIYAETGGYFGALTVDETNRKLYYTDYNNLRICNIDLSSMERAVLLSTLGNPHGIIIHSSLRHMYWTEDRPSSIKRASLDNLDNAVTLLDTETLNPYAIAADFSSGLLYWGDAHYDKIETCDLDGNNRRVVATDPGSHYGGFALHGDFLYIADYNSSCVRKMDIHTFVISDEPQCVYSSPVGIATSGVVADSATSIKSSPGPDSTTTVIVPMTTISTQTTTAIVQTTRVTNLPTTAEMTTNSQPMSAVVSGLVLTLSLALVLFHAEFNLQAA